MESIEQLKQTLIQMGMALVFLIVFVLPFQILPPEGMIAFIVITIILSPAAVCFAVVHVQERRNTKSAWIPNKSNKPPKCNLINVEIETASGKKVLWRKKPHEIDFSDTAKDKVLSYLICE